MLASIGLSLNRTASLAIGAIGLAALMAAATGAQAAEPGLTGVDKAPDVVQARQYLMEALERNMNEIEVSLLQSVGTLASFKDRAYTISTVMTAYPHLFPPQTNPSTAGPKPGFQTNALPSLWQNFDTFYAQAGIAAAISYDASQSKDLAELKSNIVKLRATCDTCHAAFTQIHPDPKP